MFDWERIKTVAQLKPVKSMYIWIFIVPFVAKAFSLIDEKIPITVFSYSFELVTTLPFSWVAFYFSALLFALATAIYGVHCPKMLQDHNGYSSFNADGKNIFHLIGYAEEISYDLSKLNEDLEQDTELADSVLSFSDPNSKDFVFRNAYRLIENQARLHKPKARRMIIIFYGIAGLLLSFVLSENILTVVGFLVEGSIR